jgi:SAM-dependent methyltransferase
MNPLLRGVALAVTETFTLLEPIIEIGAYQVPGQEEQIDLRSLFPGRDYRGIDIREGPGVDLVGDVEDLPFDDGSIGTVIALNTFEHVRRFWRGFEEIRRVLRPDGSLFVSCPFNVMIHNHPSDYWRFTPEAFSVLLEDYPQRVMGWHGPEERPENIWCLALREECPAISPEQFARYRAHLPRPGVWPLRRQRRWRYRLFDWIDRRRWCAPLTERERITTELIGDASKMREPLNASSMRR